MFDLHSFIVFLLIIETYSYPLQCPDISQRQLREAGYCTNSLKSEYSCLYDTYWLWFSEQCNKIPDYVTPGEKYVISGGLRNVECSSIRYQPFPLWSNVSGECLYRKSQCKEEGQVLYKNGSHISDDACRCDYTNGYKFIRQPKLNESCTPTEEDCSCYISKCPDGSVLSSDYECVDAKQNNDSKHTIVDNKRGSLKNENIKINTEFLERNPKHSLFAMIAVVPIVLAVITCMFDFWQRKFEDLIPNEDEELKTLNALLKGIKRQIKAKKKNHKESNEGSDKMNVLNIDAAIVENKIREKKCLHSNEDFYLQKEEDKRMKEMENNMSDQMQKELNAGHTEKDEKKFEMETIKQHQDMLEIANIEIRSLETKIKFLRNQIQDMKGNIRVFCRVLQCKGTQEKHIRSDEIQNTIMLDKTDIVDKKGKTRNCSINKYTFSCDKVFGENATQTDVFDEISYLVQSALYGHNVCIFLYGQTGSGKTYTTVGSLDHNSPDCGIVPRAVREIFRTTNYLKDKGEKYHVKLTYLDIYNDQEHYLRSSDNDNMIKSKSITTDMTEDDANQLVKKASQYRSSKGTNWSSRSHNVYTFEINGAKSNTDECKESFLHIVDLAGSERLNRGLVKDDQQFKEAIRINMGLTTLLRVIRGLKRKERHVPYRDSKLTFLLKNSLNESSKIVLFVNVSPNTSCFTETLHTFHTASMISQCNIGIKM